MVSFNVSVHNSSPLISYTAAWLDTPVGDPYSANYTASGFHATNISGATATLRFNGTGVWFYGARRPGYGSYSLNLDGNTIFTGNASSSNPIFDQLLAGSSELSMGEHTAVFMNTGGGTVDLDSVVFETRLGTEDQHVASQVVDDSNTVVNYLPSPSDWSIARNSFFSNGSAHYTNTNGAEATLTFSGEAIAVYGGVSFDHGEYTITLDGQKKSLNGANGQARIYHPQSLLFFATGLGQGMHRLDISTANGYFDLDTIETYQAAGGNPGSNSTGGMEMQPNNLRVNAANDNSSEGAANQSLPLSKSVIAGIVAASLLGLLSVIAIAIFLVSQSRKRRTVEGGQAQGPDAQSPVFPIQHPDPDLEAGLNSIDRKDFAPDGKRSTNRFTVKSFASRWSQASHTVGAPYREEKSPTMPPMPPMPVSVRLTAAPKPSTPVPPQHKRSESSISGRSGSPTLHSPDDESVLDDYYYRQSTGSQNSVAPLRPARPPGLDLGDLDRAFDRVPL